MYARHIHTPYIGTYGNIPLTYNYVFMSFFTHRGPFHIQVQVHSLYYTRGESTIVQYRIIQTGVVYLDYVYLEISIFIFGPVCWDTPRSAFPARRPHRFLYLYTRYYLTSYVWLGCQLCGGVYTLHTTV